MDVRFSRFEILTGTGALFFGILFICIAFEAARIERGIAVRVLQSLQVAGLYWVAVAPAGRALVISGAAADPVAVEQAGALGAAVSGVRSIDNRIAVIGDAGACQQRLNAVLDDRRVGFKGGRAELTDGSHAALAVLAENIRQCGVRVEVAVHERAGAQTDGRGSAAVSLALSQRRAELVARGLVERGLSAALVTATGYGITQPVPDGPQADRRVEIRILGAAT